MRFLRVMGLFVLAAPLATIAIAQPARSGHLPPGVQNTAFQRKIVGTPDFGTVTESFYRVPPSDFEVDDSNTTFTGTWSPGITFDYLRWLTGGFPHLFATVHLPGGSHLAEWDMSYCDDNALGGNHMTFNLWDCDSGGTCNPTPIATFASSVFGPGCFDVGTFSAAISAYTVDNAGHFLLIETEFGALDGTNRLAGSAVGYQLQVSAAPATATFNDVPTSDLAFQFVEAFAAAQITVGCSTSPPMYCPDNFVTRRQMAVFFAKALGLNWAQ